MPKDPKGRKRPRGTEGDVRCASNRRLRLSHVGGVTLRLIGFWQTHQDGRPCLCLTPGLTFRVKSLADRQAFPKKQVQLELLSGANQNTTTTSLDPKAFRTRPHSAAIPSRRGLSV